MPNGFQIKSLTASNYYQSDPNKLTGSMTILHEGSQMELNVKLGPDECTKVFAVVAGRVAEMMQETAINAARDLGLDVSHLLEASVNRQQAQIEASKQEEVEEAEHEHLQSPPSVTDDDEIPY